MNHLNLEELVKRALTEDMPAGDITSDAIFQSSQTAKAVFIAKSPGILAGSPVAAEVFRQLDPAATCTALFPEGAKLKPGMIFAKLSGEIRALLAGERVALNFLQHLSGIATYTAQLVTVVQGTKARIVDTRKTTPGLRQLEKYAVRMGGGHNHRFNLSDAVLIKDNHIAACGSIHDAVARTRAYIPHTMKIEVETENEAQVREALEAGVEIIMLDNMTPRQMTDLVKVIAGKALVEASGGITLENIRAVAESGVDLISVGALTHSVKALDISMIVEGVAKL
jgi:nicotinate-nucleotide pyrophosphorylase (carboxylating)